MWILFVLATYTGYGVSLESTNLPSKESCLNAAAFSQKQGTSLVDIKAWCVK